MELYAIVSKESNQVVSRGGSSTPQTLRVFRSLKEAERSLNRKSSVQGELKIVKYVPKEEK